MKIAPSNPTDNPFVSEIKQILEQARRKAYSAINTAMVDAYWLVGKRIVEQEQKGEQRAVYGEYLIKELSIALTVELGKGFTERNLRNFRQFYLTFPESEIRHTLCTESETPIRHTLCSKSDSINNHLFLRKLSWSHIRCIMRVPNSDARDYYLKEAAENTWSVRTLDRNIATLYYERLLMSPSKEPVVQEMKEKTKNFQQDKLEFIKNPCVLEFLNLPANTGYTEAELEKALISNLQHFLLELGKGFAFVERQQLLRTETNDYYLDLVFYNYFLKCFVLIDLKTNRITHQDVGQMDMYVRMYDELKCNKDDNPTIGIILCTDTDQDIARYSILKGNEQIFASKYKLYLPTEEELRAEIEREKMKFRLQMEK